MILEYEYYSWEKIIELVSQLAEEILKTNRRYSKIIGVERGGIVPAVLLSRKLKIKRIAILPIFRKKLITEDFPLFDKDSYYLIVDDIYDTGSTYSKIIEKIDANICDFAFLITRYEHKFGFTGEVIQHNRWIQFPWETV